MADNQSIPMDGPKPIDMGGLGAVMTNLTLITDILKPYSLTLPDYLALTGGFPTEPLALPPKHMDIAEYKEIAEALFADVQQARDSDDSNAINQALKARWNHLFNTRPIDAAKFRARLSELFEQRCELMYNVKRNV